jgi:hypothetical protein
MHFLQSLGNRSAGAVHLHEEGDGRWRGQQGAPGKWSWIRSDQFTSVNSAVVQDIGSGISVKIAIWLCG